ncbi:MAG: response regulator, partial [candidate division Zixibacteria bacterium]|nr:response regulator [candidate division Zixibacteria bacterium]
MNYAPEGKPTGGRPTILIVDDDPDVLEALAMVFEDDYNVLTADSGPKAVAMVRQNENIAAVVMDIKMDGMDGRAATREIRKIRAETPVIYHTGYPGEYDERTIDAEDKPFDYVTKGRSLPELRRSVRNAVDYYELKTNTHRLLQIAEIEYKMIGHSTAMQEVFRTITQVAPTDCNVMILGETGTGKELVAKAIHNGSARSRHHFGILNCNHKDSDLVESELFGHLKGSFTHALSVRSGLFEFARGGTVFLDEVGDLAATTQERLLRVVESGEFQPLGATELRTTDVRLVCATNRDLEMLRQNGLFRDDLYYRLCGIKIVLPPLRERKEDIPALVDLFMRRLTTDKGKPPKIMDVSARAALIDYDWPGNVRQLLRTVERLIIMTPSD